MKRILSIAFAATLFSSAAVFGQGVDYGRLVAERGTVEDGAPILFSMVEADTNGDPNIDTYMPDLSNSGLAGDTIIDVTGTNMGSSNHATGMARALVGVGYTPAADNLRVYSVNDYINREIGFVSGNNPVAPNYKVQSHSWIGNFAAGSAGDAAAENVLMRVDYMIDTYDISMQVGINNNNSGNATTQPQLLGQGYNSISVGVTDGTHSRGQTTVYGAGRTRPHVVLDTASTSTATAWASSGIGFLHHKALVEGNADASKSVMMKAIFLGGATKSEVPGWSRTTTSPVDEVYGVGEANLYNSYYILEGGETDGSTVQGSAPKIGLYGYDYGESIDETNNLYYDFDIAASTGSWRDLQFTLTWNMKITDLDPGDLFDPMATLANMDMRLFDSAGNLIDASLSDIDNLEHLYFANLSSGSYTLELTSDREVDFGLAWHARIPEPNSFLVLISSFLLSLLPRRKKLVPARVRK